MSLFHKHDWSKWVQATEFNSFNHITQNISTIKFVIRVCVECGKEQRRDGDIWLKLLKDGEL